MNKLLITFAALALVLWAVPAMAEDCVDVELGAQLVTGDPYDILSLYFMAVNCGSEPGMVNFTVTLEKDFMEIGTAEFVCYMPAGEPFEQELELPIPDYVPAGTYTLCVTATLGEATDTSCASITLDEENNVTSFTLYDPVGNEDSSWGEIKEMYR